MGFRRSWNETEGNSRAHLALYGGAQGAKDHRCSLNADMGILRYAESSCCQCARGEAEACQRRGRLNAVPCETDQKAGAAQDAAQRVEAWANWKPQGPAQGRQLMGSDHSFHWRTYSGGGGAKMFCDRRATPESGRQDHHARGGRHPRVLADAIRADGESLGAHDGPLGRQGRSARGSLRDLA